MTSDSNSVDTLRLEDYAKLAKGQSADALVAQLSGPILLHKHTKGHGSERAFRTMILEKSDVSTVLEDAAEQGPVDERVLVVGKRPGGTFSGQVSVGRTRQADICLPYVPISKFHAYFTWSIDKTQYWVTDAGSTNGTFYNTERLFPNQRVELQDGGIIDFGPFRFMYYSPTAFAALLWNGV